MPHKLILASGSAARKTLLEKAGFIFDIVPAAIDEDALKEELQHAQDYEIALALACEKANAVAQIYPGSIVIGADQICVFENQILSKSKTIEEAIDKLKIMQGKPHQLISAAAVFVEGELTHTMIDTVDLHMKPLTNDQIQSYARKAGDDLLSCVGGYAFEGIGAQLFDHYHGDYFSILGLPLLQLINALDQEGLSPL